MHTITEVIFR